MYSDEEEWLIHYMHGKIAEKRKQTPVEYLKLYKKVGSSWNLTFHLALPTYIQGPLDTVDPCILAVSAPADLHSCRCEIKKVNVSFISPHPQRCPNPPSPLVSWVCGGHITCLTVFLKNVLVEGCGDIHLFIPSHWCISMGANKPLVHLLGACVRIEVKKEATKQ